MELGLRSGGVDLRTGKVAGTAGHTLTPKELALLSYLVDRPGRVLERDELMREVWGYAETVASRTLEVTVQRLRAKIERDPAKPEHLLTERNVGYRFEPDPPVAIPSDRTGIPKECLPLLEAACVFESSFSRESLESLCKVGPEWETLRSFLEFQAVDEAGWRRYSVRPSLRGQGSLSDRRRETLYRRHLEFLIVRPAQELPAWEADVLAAAARFGRTRTEEVCRLLLPLCERWLSRGEADLGRLDAVLAFAEGIEAHRLRLERARLLAAAGETERAFADIDQVRKSRWRAGLRADLAFCEGWIRCRLPESRTIGIQLLEEAYLLLQGARRIACADRLAGAHIAEDQGYRAKPYLALACSPEAPLEVSLRAEYSLAIQRIREGEYEAAGEASDRSLALALRSGERRRLPYLLTLRAWLDSVLVSFERGEATFQQAQQWLVSGDPARFTWAKHLAEHRLAHGRRESGQEILVSLDSPEGREALGPWLDELIGWNAVDLGDEERARRAFLSMGSHERASLGLAALEGSLEGVRLPVGAPADTRELWAVVFGGERAPKQLLSRYAVGVAEASFLHVREEGRSLYEYGSADADFAFGLSNKLTWDDGGTVPT